jgi:hypothetical protein
MRHRSLAQILVPWNLVSRHEVPRMLVEHGQIEELESYVQSSQDKELMKWWAKYCESHGSLEKALECYHWVSRA